MADVPDGAGGARVTCENCMPWRKAYVDTVNVVRELKENLRVAERRNAELHAQFEVFNGVIRLHDGLAHDRKEAAKRRSLVMKGAVAFW